MRTSDVADKEEGDSGIDANSQGSCSSNDIKTNLKRKEKKKKKGNKNKDITNDRNNDKSVSTTSKPTHYQEATEKRSEKEAKNSKSNRNNILKNLVFEATKSPADRDDFEATGSETIFTQYTKRSHNEPTGQTPKGTSTSPKDSSKREEGWNQVKRKPSASDTVLKKVIVPSNAISRVIGRGGSNINTIRGATGAYIEVEKQTTIGQGNRTITIKGSTETTKQAHSMITTLIKDPDVDILQMLPKSTKIISSTTSLWDKTQIGTKKSSGKVSAVSQPVASTTSSQSKPAVNAANPASTRAAASSVKTRNTTTVISSRTTAPRLAAQAEKNAAAAAQTAIPTRNQITHVHSGTTAAVNRIPAKVIPTTASQTFAAKLTETTHISVGIPVSKPRNLGVPQGSVGPVSPQSVNNPLTHSSPVKHSRPTPTTSAPPTIQHYQNQGKTPIFTNQNARPNSVPDQTSISANLPRSTTPNPIQACTSLSQEELSPSQQKAASQAEYSLFAGMWSRLDNESQKPQNFAAVTGGANSQVITQTKYVDEEPPPEVDAAKAPGYRGGSMCSPVSSKASSCCSSTTPPNISSTGASSYQNYNENSKNQSLPPIGSNMAHNRPQSATQVSQSDMSNNYIYTEMYKAGSLSNIPPNNMLNIATSDSQLLQTAYLPTNSMQNMNFTQQQQANIPPVSMSRLNPKAPDFSSSGSMYAYQKQVYNNYPMNSENIYQMPKGNVDNIHRTNLPHRWQMMQMPQPFPQSQQADLAGLSGITITNLARRMEESNGDLNIVNNSPNMSPNMVPVHSMPPADSHYLDDRKPPQPIGTERARKTYNPNVDPNRLMTKDARWNMSTANYANRYPPKGQFDDMTIMDLQAHNMPLDPSQDFSNGPTIQQQQQQQQQPQPQHQKVPHHYLIQQQVQYPTNFIDMDPSKVDKQWEYSGYMNDVPDKGHGWINKWNQ